MHHEVVVVVIAAVVEALEAVEEVEADEEALEVVRILFFMQMVSNFQSFIHRRWLQQRPSRENQCRS